MLPMSEETFKLKLTQCQYIIYNYKPQVIMYVYEQFCSGCEMIIKCIILSGSRYQLSTKCEILQTDNTFYHAE